MLARPSYGRYRTSRIQFSLTHSTKLVSCYSLALILFRTRVKRVRIGSISLPRRKKKPLCVCVRVCVSLAVEDVSDLRQSVTSRLIFFGYRYPVNIIIKYELGSLIVCGLVVTQVTLCKYIHIHRCVCVQTCVRTRRINSFTKKKNVISRIIHIVRVLFLILAADVCIYKFCSVLLQCFCLSRRIQTVDFADYIHSTTHRRVLFFFFCFFFESWKIRKYLLRKN